MAEMNLSQITHKLQELFEKNSPRLVFWYDEKAEFSEDIQGLALPDGVQLYLLEPDALFKAKHHFERTDTTGQYLVYAPFPKPSPAHNHLEDTWLYSGHFFASLDALLMVDLNMAESCRPTLQQHLKFFAAKERLQKLKDLEIDSFTQPQQLQIALMSVLCKSRIASFDEVLRVVICDDFTNNAPLAEFEKYDLVEPFWQFCNEALGFTDPLPTVEKLVVTLFVTGAGRALQKNLPPSWQSFASYKSGSILAFMDNLMNSRLYAETFDQLSAKVAKGLQAEKAFAALPPEQLLHCDYFAQADKTLLSWMNQRLLAEDTGAALQGLNIPEIADLRAKMHFGSGMKEEYTLMTAAYAIIGAAKYTCPQTVESLATQYTQKDWQIDAAYRSFYTAFDSIDHNHSYDLLRVLVENIYTNEYLAKITRSWTAALGAQKAFTALPLQRQFYKNHLRNAKEKTVVILSDALRYEVGVELYKRLLSDQNSTVELSSMMSVLPSYTRLGMAALLPHSTLELTEDYKVLADGLPCENTLQRQKILQAHAPTGICIQYDDVMANKQKTAMQELFRSKEVVYIYHDQIDARGDKAATENEVFTACAEAVDELYTLVRRIANNGNTYRFIITADHGFIYKRVKVEESDKISGISGGSAFTSRRFVVAPEPIQTEGVANSRMGDILGNEDEKFVSYPVSSNVFKVAGGGQNYVHGGASPQEMLVPVLHVKMAKGAVETKPASVALVSLVQKVTNLITTLDFIQQEPVSDIIKPATYKLYFISEENERISNECIYIADSSAEDPQSRIFRLRFNFKNKKYDKAMRYFLICYDASNDIEQWRHDVVMDIAFADDFGFSL